MAEYDISQTLEVLGVRYELTESVDYPNGGSSFFYTANDTAIVIDYDIWLCGDRGEVYEYSRITDKQNQYMRKYSKVFRFAAEDLDTIAQEISIDEEEQIKPSGIDRSNMAEASPLEMMFEDSFAEVYGTDSLKYLNREYGITDRKGKNFFLDYLVHTDSGDIAVEENGVSYHHPQIIGLERYRYQLHKQNTCARWGIKLYRFSSEDCRFKGRIEDDIRMFFGTEPERFSEKGILVNRSFKLYEHQEITLKKIQELRAEGTKAFLAVFPTATGKSRIVEEDLKVFLSDNSNAKVLILAPNLNIIIDWKERLAKSLENHLDNIEIRSFAYMAKHSKDLPSDYYSYIVIDEAHHAVAPGLKRVIQYYCPQFLIGLTATDERLDGKKLEEVFGLYETGLSLTDAMEKGIVAQANVYRIETNLDLSEVRFNGRDYVNADLEKSIRVNSRNELIVDVICKYFNEGEGANRQGVIFCVNVAHTKEMAKLLCSAGITAAAYSSKEKNQDDIMDRFKNGEIRFLCSCNMISEGWDYPELGIIVMARPTISKVLYLQQIGRGLRKTSTKSNVYIIDVVDEYGAMVRPCSMHSIFANSKYVPFGNILKRNYIPGDTVEIDGIVETVERIIPVDIATFEDQYGDYLNQEQLAREFFMSTGSIMNWIKNGRIKPSVQFKFGSRKIHLFSPDNVEDIRVENNITIHDDSTIYDDFFEFLETRDYTLSYKMPFLISFIDHMNEVGDAEISDVLDDYIAFYMDRIDKGLPVDRSTCPYTAETLSDRGYIQRNMLTNPFEKFERKRFMYYSRELGKISINHALAGRLSSEDWGRVRKQMVEDLDNYYMNV